MANEDYKGYLLKQFIEEENYLNRCREVYTSPEDVARIDALQDQLDKIRAPYL
jgi:hypothetical protein